MRCSKKIISQCLFSGITFNLVTAKKHKSNKLDNIFLVSYYTSSVTVIVRLSPQSTEEEIYKCSLILCENNWLYLPSSIYWNYIWMGTKMMWNQQKINIKFSRKQKHFGDKISWVLWISFITTFGYFNIIWRTRTKKTQKTNFGVKSKIWSQNLQ